MSINKILDRDIKVIKQSMEAMIEETKVQYASTFSVMRTNDYVLAQKVIENDKVINDMQNHFTSMAMWKIAKQQMVAGDLRLAIGSILISREIERIADYAKLICNFFVEYKPTKDESDAILQLFELVINMLDTISHIFNNYNVDETQKVIKLEKELNNQFEDLFQVFFVRIRKVKTDEQALLMMNMVKQLKNLESAGDHLVSVQEIVTFIRTGKFGEVDKDVSIWDEEY